MPERKPGHVAARKLIGAGSAVLLLFIHPNGWSTHIKITKQLAHDLLDGDTSGWRVSRHPQRPGWVVLAAVDADEPGWGDDIEVQA